ncbi:MAG: energy-coupling factor transporter transmembrane protein EcfT [Prochlorococcus sp.]|jgi:energy-coupling factor transport system permease protein|nr:CbiQ family ECF transporter T component [Prochlorococcaceae cyanobacterium ETNP18_MAG_1]CAI8181914.1 MAG: Energy-coupling factor transporter transmembrane protein EcfT [Prochlorococcus marinus str. MIT 9215]
MDWLRQVPIGQYVAGRFGWLRCLDSRLKLAWVLMFLLTPVLAASFWRIDLCIALLAITFASGLPARIWWRPLAFLILLAGVVGLLAMYLPTGDPPVALAGRSPQELPAVTLSGASWEIFRLGPLRFGPLSLGPLVVDRRSAELGLNTATLIFTVVHSVNLMLLTTKPEDLVWALSWYLSPLALIGVPVDRLSFQLLLALRFLPLVQEELQNLLRSLASRAVNLRQLGFKVSFGLILSVAERLLANILLRAEQGADALIARGGFWLAPDQFRPQALLVGPSRWLNIGSGLLLLFVLGLRGKYGGI